MKKTAVLCAVMALSCVSARANVRGGQTELSLLGGSGETDIKDSVHSGVKASEPSSAGLQLMYNLFPMFALGAEADNSWGPEDTKMKLHSASVLARLTLIPGWRLHPYVMGGIGYANFQVSTGDGYNVGVVNEKQFKGLITTLGAGINIDVTKHIFIGGECRYRIMPLKNSDFLDLNGGTLAGNAKVNEFMFLGRLGIKFGGTK